MTERETDNRAEDEEDPGYVGYIGTRGDGGIAPDMLREELGWRMGFVAGYCASTGKEHVPEDFEEAQSGMLEGLMGRDEMRCSDCGLIIPDEDYKRLEVLDDLKGDLGASRRKVKIG